MSAGRAFLAVVVLGLAALGVYRVVGDGPATSGSGAWAAPVEVAPIEHGPIELRRTFSGTLDARSEFAVAAKVGGRLQSLGVDIGDRVRRGQVVAELDHAEYVNEVTQAEADLAVARANLARASSALHLAEREFTRVETLSVRGVASESELDLARAELAAERAQREVSRAQVVRAEAALETARIRLRYTRVEADWTDGDAERAVAERYVDAGQTVSAGEALMRIVELSPLTGVLFVTEKEYGRLRPGQPATLVTDAYPGEVFTGAIDRIAPVFRENSRQARVELEIANADERLKPGMFVRATVVLDRVEEALSVPESALTQRGDRTGVFVVDETAGTVHWRPVTPGIRNAGRVQISGPGLTGRVVTLGQQLIADGSQITIPADAAGSEAP